MASTSASAQIAFAIKATLDGYELPQISKEPTILTVKIFMVGLCQMAAAVESNKLGGQFGRMHLILKKKEYRIDTNDKNATVNLLKKPPSVHPGFQTLKKEELTKYKVLQLEAETKQQTDAYLTQKETAKEIVRRMVANIDADYIEELNNEYTGYNNETPKSLLAHISGSYCKTTVTNQLKADSNFAKPWDQVANLGTWITRLEQLLQKCKEVGVAIDDGCMVLKITENAKKYALFTNGDHEAYDDLPIHNLDAVIKFWVKNYKVHNTYQQTQAVANQYKSAAYAGPPPNEEAVRN
jgi:hypothetical protein